MWILPKETAIYICEKTAYLLSYFIHNEPIWKVRKQYMHVGLGTLNQIKDAWVQT